MGDWIRRPAFLALLVFIGGIIVARWLGYLEPATGLLSAGQTRRLEACVVSPLKLELQGSKVVARMPEGELIEIFFPRSWPAERVPLTGQEVVFSGRLRKPRPARNPGEFDEQAFLADRGIGWVLQADRAEVLRREFSWRWAFTERAEGLRRSIEATFAARLPPVEARLLDGITLGDKGPLPREVNAAVQDAGVMHLLVPSGAKVGLVFLLVAGVGWLLALTPWARWALAALLAGGYVVMLGGEPPYARAYWCALALGAGLASGRECAPFDAFILSAWAILLLCPRDLFSLGFQMTYAAALGLCVLLPRLRSRVPPSWPRPARWAAEALAASAIVQLALAPLLASAFGRVSLIAVVANVALVPFATVIAAGGLVLCVFAPAARWEAALLRLFLAGCRSFASVPFAAVPAPPPSAALAAAWTRVRAPRAQAVFLALPKGQAALLTVGGRERWLVEGGAPAGPVLRALQAEGRPSVEHIIADLSEASSRALPRLRSYAPDAAVEREKSFYWREKNVVLGFWPPAFKCGRNEFSILVVHRRAEITAATDGITVKIH